MVEVSNYASLPVTGEVGKIYVTLDTNKTYRWGGSSYTEIAKGAVESVNTKTGVVTLTPSDIGAEPANVNIQSHISNGNIHVTTGQTASWDAKQNALGFTPENSANKGQANGYTPLGADSKVSVTYLPNTNVIETVQKNGVNLTVSGKTVNVIVPTTPGDIGAQPAGTYSTDIHSNITALNAVSGVNTGDQDLSGYSLTGHTHTGVYEPANANIQTHISNSNIHVTTGQTASWDAKQNALGFTPENSANKGQANGYAPLGSDSKVPAIYLPSGSTGGGDINIIEVVQRNGVALQVTGRTVNVIVPTTPGDIGAQPAGTYSTDIHSNITALNAVSGVNTGDQDLSGYSLTGHTHTGVYEPANANIQSHISNNNIHVTTGQTASWDAKQDALGFTPENSANKGQANGYVPLDGTVKISSTYLPSYVDDVVEVANYASLPVTGEVGKIYVTLDTNKTYRWSGSAYVEIAKGAVESVNTKTGVVTLTPSDIGAQPAGTYSTDIHSNITALNAVSGVNTGDQDLSGYSLTGHTHTGVYEPANANIQSHISNSNIHVTTGQTAIWDAKQDALGFVSETQNKFLRDDNTFQNVDMSVGGYANNLYYDETPSDISGYETLSYTPQVTGYTETITVNGSEGEKLHMNYIYPTAVSVTQIPSGVWSFTFYGKISNNSGITQLGVTYFARSVGGIETDLFTLWSGEINNTVDDWIKFETTNPVFNVELTDRMGIRIKAKTTHNQNITITYTVGDGYGAWLNNPNKIRHSQLRALNEDTSYQHIDSTTSKNTPIDNDALALWDSITSKTVLTSWSNTKTNLKTYFDQSYSSIASVNLKRDKTEIGDAHGFVNPPNLNNFLLSNTGSTIAVTLLVGAGNYKINGTDYTNNGLSLTFTADLGQNFLNINSSGLFKDTGIFIEDLTKIPCCTVSWDGTNAVLADELHKSSRNLAMHKAEHDTDGCRWVRGGVTTFGSLANNTFSALECVVRDEERYHTLVGTKTQGSVVYRNSALTAMITDAPSTRFCKLVETTTGVPYYDLNGVLTALGNNQYGVYWMYATNRKLPANSEYAFVMGQGTYSSLANAQSASQPTFVGMAVAEWKLLYRVIVRSVSGSLNFIQADDLRLTSSGLAVSGSGVSSLPASNVTVIPSGGITATEAQSALTGLDTRLTAVESGGGLTAAQVSDIATIQALIFG